MRFHDLTISHDEKWYYELDGRARGPMRWSDLEELLGSAGETASQVRVRKGVDAPWTVFRSGGLTSSTTAIKATSSERTKQVPVARRVIEIESGGIALFYRQHRQMAAMAGVWIVLNALFVAFLPEPNTKERRYLATLQDVIKEVDDFRSVGASNKEWAALAKRTKERLAPMIADLQKSASSSELPRQQLLWCARDLAPRIMGLQTKECEDNERRMKQYLRVVNEALD